MMAATTATAPCVLPALPVEMAAEFLKQQLQADDLHELGGVGHVPAQPHGMRLQSDATFTTATSSSSVPSASASGAFSSPEAQVRAWPGAGAGAGSDSDDFMLDDVQPDFGQLEDLLKFMPDGVKLVTEPGATPKIECAPTTAVSGTPTAAAVQAKTLRIHSSTLVGTASSASTTSSNAPVLPVLLPMAPTSAPTASAASGAITITDALSAGFAAPTSNTATTAAAPTATAATVAASVAPPPPRPRTSAPKPRRSTTRRARTKRAMPDLDVPEEPIKIDESLLAGLDPKKRKKQLRLLRNRASASRSRLRKKAQSEFLARELDELRVLTDDQVKDITALTQRNDELETEVADLRTQLGLPPRRRDPVHIITAAAMSARSRDGSSTIHSSDDDSTSNSGSGSGSGSGAAPLKRQRRAPPKHRAGGVGGRNAAAGGAVLLAVVFAFALGAFNIADLITHDGPGLMGGASPLRTTSNGRVLLQHDHEATLAMGAATATADGRAVDPSAPALLSPSAAAAAAVNALALPHLAKVVLVNAVILLVIVSMSMFALGRWSTATAVAAQAPASSPKRRHARVTASSGTSSSSSSDSDDGSSVDSCSAPESRRKQGGIGVGAGVGAGAGAGAAVAEQLGIAPRLSRYAQSVLAAALVSTATGNYASFARSLSAAPASAVQTALQQRYEGAVAAGVPPPTSVASDDGTRGPGRGRASTDPMPTT